MGVTINPFTGEMQVTSGGGAADANAFSIIQPDVGTSPTADSTTDTLTVTGTNHISTSGNSGTKTITVTSDATDANTASKIVARDASGNFSAGTITASLTGNASGTAANVTASSNSTITTLSALSLPGSQVSGNITGSAANVTGTVAETHGGTNQTSYTTGDTLYASATNTIAKLGIGAAGQSLRATVGGLPSWEYPGSVATSIFMQDDFLNSSNGGFYLLASQTGTGSGFTLGGYTDSGKKLGYRKMETGTTTTGLCNLTMNNSTSPIVFGQNIIIWECVAILNNLSDGTDTFIVSLGMGSGSAPSFGWGAFFRYTHSNNSGKWESITSNNGSYTIKDTGITADTTTWRRFTVMANAAGTSISFYIDGVLVATPHTTNIPNQSNAGNINVQVGIFKSAGTTTKSILLDSWGLGIIFGTAR